MLSLLSVPSPTSTLFPYTTLFRSAPPRCADEDRGRRLNKRGSQRAYRWRTTYAPRCGFEAHRWSSTYKRADRKSTRLNSSHLGISYAVFCLKKKKIKNT